MKGNVRVSGSEPFMQNFKENMPLTEFIADKVNIYDTQTFGITKEENPNVSSLEIPQNKNATYVPGVQQQLVNSPQKIIQKNDDDEVKILPSKPTNQGKPSKPIQLRETHDAKKKPRGIKTKSSVETAERTPLRKRQKLVCGGCDQKLDGRKKSKFGNCSVCNIVMCDLCKNGMIGNKCDNCLAVEQETALLENSNNNEEENDDIGNVDVGNAATNDAIVVINDNLNFNFENSDALGICVQIE